jgi:hypothetical protein
MKKILFILVLTIASLLVNAQPATTDGKVTFNLPASLLESPKHVVVPINELPKVITDNVAKDHSGFTIKEATWDWSSTLVPNNIFIYNVIITNGTNDEALLYDKEGKFLKKGNVKAGTAEKK